MSRLQLGAALVSGGGSGIGADLSLALAERSVAVTVADIDGAAAAKVAGQIRQRGGRAISVQCDVSDSRQHLAAFQAHQAAWGRLDYALLNAGIGERGDLVWTRSGNWRQTLDIDLTAVAEGVRLATRAMVTGSPEGRRSPSPGGGDDGPRSSGGSQAPPPIKGVIMVTASAGGTFPMPEAPVYAAAKAGCINLTRSLAEPLRKQGVRICALCPQFTDTPLVQSMPRAKEVMKGTHGRLLKVEQVTQAGLALLADPTKIGTCLVVLVDGSWVEPQRTRFKSVPMPAAAAAAAVDPTLLSWATRGRPPSITRAIEVHRLSLDFGQATRIVTRQLPAALPPGCVLIRRLYAGINASDVNYTAGRYFGSKAAAEKRLPFDAGFEAVGVVAAAAPGVAGLAVGQPVATMTYGGFADWAVVLAKQAFPLPRASPEMVALMTSGLTASIALEQAGLRKGQTVLVTAAAGGTGQLAVQLAVLAGCHVLGTCSGGAKETLLKSLGCHRVINYKTESLKAVLKAEFPKGVDVVYESVGGDMFDVCVDALAPRGHLIIIGAMSQYAGGWEARAYPGIAEKLLWKSATLQGFFLLHYARDWGRHLKKLAGLLDARRLRVQMDPRRFVGLEAVAEAVQWLQSGRSVGKVFVQLPADADLPPAARARL
ncbi:zinc-binding alcohol dehydrogenase domain-containing 2 [Micractinium conductrix]|uniref:Zinc-binding alcohol dehydrogenase domain-containing 2 n=1 Tax=Micractinium conductrix TaxID=554055 RepID=A0A2P6VAD6_9CHLO|nr:zinc-binding alcohol dehydrogenase domain-containing 2 [Micractinium conductrix]|eukprot:PSC71056.1 zinc-binding alcohol dehydrogenase domain-containing 2 [Micractinium conductrix]